MMKIQYEAIIQKLYEITKDEFELDTEEGKDLFFIMGNALFEAYVKAKVKT